MEPPAMMRNVDERDVELLSWCCVDVWRTASRVGPSKAGMELLGHCMVRPQPLYPITERCALHKAQEERARGSGLLYKLFQCMVRQ